MDHYRIKPGQKVSLDDFDPGEKSEFANLSKDEGRRLLQCKIERFAELQRVLYAEDKHRILIVLQAMDTGGKDGTIRHVFSGINPQGVFVWNFGKPSAEELDHDYLWRIHDHAPGRGLIAVFNRSHYEDIIAVRTKKLAPESVWSKRYRHLVEFEKMLADEGATILKFFLNISKDEQKKRLQERLDDPDKRWKFNPSDLDDRARWDQFMETYEDVFKKTSTDHAPWFVIPANHKWYRDLVIVSTIVEALEKLKMAYPPIVYDPEKVVID